MEKKLDPFWKEKILEAYKHNAKCLQDNKSCFNIVEMERVLDLAERKANEPEVSPLVRMVLKEINNWNSIDRKNFDSELQKAFDESGAWDLIVAAMRYAGCNIREGELALKKLQVENDD